MEKKVDKTSQPIIWILTEERAKIDAIKGILHRIDSDKILDKRINITDLKIKPIINNKKFQFEYEIEGVTPKTILKIVRGKQGSFVDYLVFYQLELPNEKDLPYYAIEETKTTTDESRNVAVNQRLTKFVFIDHFENMKKTKKIMMYTIRKNNKTAPATFVFGIRIMKTLDIDIMGLKESSEHNAFENLEDLEEAKNRIANKQINPNNVPVKILVSEEQIIITGKLEKSGRLGHDPNIGSITSLAKTIKTLDSQNRPIMIRNHGLDQKMIDNTHNKFIKIATELNLKLEDLELPRSRIEGNYWEYSKTGEKIVSVMFHHLLEYHDYQVIYENHAGCEQGYFETPNGKLDTIEKVTKKPDMVIIDKSEKILYVIEAEPSENVFKHNMGISQLENFDGFEKKYCGKYDDYKCERYVICYGDSLIQEKVNNPKILFQLKTNGEIMFSGTCPTWIKKLFT